MLTNGTTFTPDICEASVLTRLRAFVEMNEFYRQLGVTISDDENFFQRTGAESKCVAEMISFIENESGVLVANCEVCEDNPGSLRAVAHFVADKQLFAVG
jgi:hypothetical protein